MIDAAAIGAFVDACIADPSAARRLAAANPELLQAQWAGDPLLHWMVIEDFAAGAATLLDLGVQVDARDDAGRTALHCACAAGRRGASRLPNRCRDWPSGASAPTAAPKNTS